MTTRRVLKPASPATPKSQPAATTGRTGSTKPGPGAVINYVYLFATEQAAGRDEGVKERPVVVVAADDRGYIVVPVTTKGEIDPVNTIPLPAEVGQAMGLPRASESAIVVSEANSFDWMGHDVRELPSGSHLYGIVPPGFFAKIVREVLARRTKPIDRR